MKKNKIIIDDYDVDDVPLSHNEYKLLYDLLIDHCRRVVGRNTHELDSTDTLIKKLMKMEQKGYILVEDKKDEEE